MMSGKLRLLPSELGRLVLGYLKQHDCHDAAENFLKELPELGECLAVQKLGRPVCTTVGDRSLEDMLNDYADTREQVQNSIQQHPGILRQISKSWDLNQQLMEITKIATEKSTAQELGMLGRKSANTQIVRTRLLNKQLRNSMVTTPPCCDHCSLRTQERPNPLLDVSTTSIKDLPGSPNHSSSNPVEDNQILLKDLSVCVNQDSPFSQKDTGLLKRMQSRLHAEFDSQLNIETSSSSQDLCSSNISSSSIDATPQKRKGNQVKRRSHGQTGTGIIQATVEEDVHFEIMLKKLMEDTNLHEKIAENINRGLSTSQSRSLQETVSPDENCSSEALKSDGSKVAKPGINSTFPFELDSIITNIVSETTDSPTFESILEEVFGSSLQKCTNMNSEEIQNELSKIVTRPLSTPVPQSQSAENSTNQRISTVCKENQNQEDKICDAKIRMSSQVKNDQCTNEVQPDSINTLNDNDNVTRLALNKTKKLDTDIPNTDTSSKNENSLFHRSEMNVPHKFRHKLNRKSTSIQVNLSSCATSQTDHLLIKNSQLLEKNETNNENLNNYITEKKSENSKEKCVKHINNTEDIIHEEMQSKDLGITEKNMKNKNCINQMSPKRPLAEMENPYQVDVIDNECEGSRVSLNESYRISDISNIPIANKNKSKTESDVIEPVKHMSKSLLQNTSLTPQENIFTVPDNKDVNDNPNQEIISNNVEMTTDSSADIISRNTTPIKSMTIPGIATTVHVKQVESPYKIVERNDSTLTELKSMRSDMSSSKISGQWPPTLNTSLNIEDNNSKPSNLDSSSISISSSNISNVSEKNVNVKSSTSTTHIENSFSKNCGIKSLAPVQIIPLPMNVGQKISCERYRRIGPRSIAPRPIAPKSDSNLSRRQNIDKNEPKNPDNIQGDSHTPDTPIIELPIDTVIYPATKNIIPAPVTTYKLPNNIVFTIPNISSVNPIPDQNAKIGNLEENKRGSPSKKKCPKSPIRGRSVNMTRVKPKTGVGKAGKRKLRHLNNLENISKTNELVSAAVTLLLSPSHTKTKSPFKQAEIQTDGKFNDSLITIIQNKANALLNEKQIERNSEEKNCQLGSVSPKLKELLQISKDIGSDRKRTKCSSLHKSPINKGLPSRGSQSTPSHKNSHIRALDFGTPGKDISPRKLRRQQVMQSLNFSPSLRFKKTMKNSSLDDNASVSCSKFSPKKRILERIQEETNNSLPKEEFMEDERIKEYPIHKKKPRKRKNLPSVKTKSNINQKDCSEIMKNPLSSEYINNSVNKNIVCDSSNNDLILETPVKTNDILTLELATPFLKSFKKICDNNDDLNTPFPKISVDREQNKSPKIDNDITTSTILSTHYQPGVQEQDEHDLCKTVSHPRDIKNSENNHKEDKKGQKKNIISKNRINQKKKSEINMGKKIEEEIASRFGSSNRIKLQVDISMNNTDLSKQSCLPNHDVNSKTNKEVEKSSGKCNESKYIRLGKKVTKTDKCKVMGKEKVTPQKGEISPKRVTRSAKKLEDSLCINKENITKSSSSQKPSNDNESQDKSNEHKKVIEKVSHNLTEQHCKNTALLSAEILSNNMASENLVIREKFSNFKECKENFKLSNSSDESSSESSKWQIDDELQEIKSLRTVANIEDQKCSEFLQCENINSDSNEDNKYCGEGFDDMTLGFSEFIDLFSLNLTNKEISQKKLNKRLLVEGSSGWSPKRKRPCMIGNQGRQTTANQVESPINKSQKLQETLIEEERMVEMREVTEQYITPVRGSVSERSVGSSVSSNSPGRLVILQSPYWMLDENVTTPNQSIGCENKEDCSQSNKSSPIEGIETLPSVHHQVTVCLKCNKEVQNSNIYLEKEDHEKGICVCESSNEKRNSSTEEINSSSETSNQYQKRSKNSKRINKVLVNGGTLEIAQSPTKQMAIVTEPQIFEMQVSSIDSTNEESNASIIPPTPGKHLDPKEQEISSSSSIKSMSNIPASEQLSKPSTSMKNKPKKVKVMKKMNIEEFLKNIHK